MSLQPIDKLRSGSIRCMALTFAFLCLLSTAGLAAGRKELQLKWSELGQTIRGKEIQLVLPGGARIEGSACDEGP
jgi:hypothetical protein